MAKLIVFDKDGTLTRAKSSGAFPRSPMDQQLFPGVLDRIQQLRSDGWKIAIASNQGGCDIFECTAEKLADGMIWHNPIGLDGIFKVKRIFNRAEDREILIYYRPAGSPGHNESNQIVASDFKCLVSYKTIESAIKECQFAADLCGITDAMFCPVMDGSSAISLVKGIEFGWRSKAVQSMPEYSEEVPNFRKPAQGMLEYQKQLMVLKPKRTVMIGDRPDDRGAAEAAGFEFFDAEEWRSGKITIDQKGEQK